MERICCERRVYELVDDKSLSCDASQKTMENRIIHAANG